MNRESIALDLSRWPIVVTVAPAEVSDAELEAFTARMTEILSARPEPYVSVVDLRQNAGMPSHQREMLSDAMNRQAARGGPCLGAGLVVSSTLLRMVVNGALIIRKPPHDTRMFNDMDTALTWAGRVLERRRQAG